MKKTVALLIALVMMLALAPTFAAAEDRVLTVATWDANAGSSGYLNAQKAAFEASHPGVTIEYLDISAQDWDAGKPATMLAGGDTTDVYDIKQLYLLQNWVEQGFLESLEPYIAESGYDIDNYVGMEQYYRSFVDGELYALPYRADFWVLFYNKTLFDAAGVDYPTNDMTWEEYKELAIKMTSGEGVDKIYGTHYHTWLSCAVNWAVCGVDYTLADGEYENLEYFYQLVQDLEDAGAAMESSEIRAASLHYRGVFETGNIAMLPMGYWFVATLIDDMRKGDSAEFEWGIVSVPHMEGVPAGSSFGAPTGAAINKNSANKDLAWEFISWRCGEAGALATASNGTRPGYVSEAVAEVLASVEGFPSDEASLAALLPSGVAIEWPVVEHLSTIQGILNEEHVSIMVRDVAIAEGIQNMNARVAEVLN